MNQGSTSMHANSIHDSTLHGGTGNYQNLGDCVAWLRAIDPHSVLDVGVGFGRWGFLCRDFLEIWNGRNRRTEWKVRLVGVEAFAGNIRPHHRLLYDEIVVGTIEGFFERCRDTFDLIILGDVLEHLPRPDGQAVLDEALGRADYVLVVLPLGGDWPQGEAYGNPFETHRAAWEAADVLRHSPLVACEYCDGKGRPFLAAVLSVEDSKGLGPQLVELASADRPRRIWPPAPPGDACTGVPVRRADTSARGAPSSETRLHVALVTTEFAPAGGGIGTYAMNLARLMGEAGHRVSVLSADARPAAPLPSNVTLHQCPPRQLPPTGSWACDWLATNRYRSGWWSRRLISIHASDPIDVIEVTDFYLEGLFLDTQHVRGPDGTLVPVVTQVQGPRAIVTAIDGAGSAPLLSKLEDFCLRQAPYRKAYSPKMCEITNRLWPGHPCEFVPAPFFADAVASAGVGIAPERALDLVYFGRLQRCKGVESLAGALKLLFAEGVCPRIAFVGGDTNTAAGGSSMAAWIEDELRPVIGDRLTIRDRMPHKELWPLVHAARVVVLPSLWEALGFTILEAFSLGRPVITSQDAGAAYLLSGDIAERTLVNPRATRALADRIHLSLDMSDVDRAAWGQKLAAVVHTEFAPHRTLNAITAYYRACIEQAAERMPAAHDASAQARRVLTIIDDFVRIAQARRAEAERLRLPNETLTPPSGQTRTERTDVAQGRRPSAPAPLAPLLPT